MTDPQIRKSFDNSVQCIRILGGNAFEYIAVQSAYFGRNLLTMD